MVAPSHMEHALQDFADSLNRGRRLRWLHAIRQHNTQLPRLADAVASTHTVQIVDRGVRTISIGDIVGTTDGNLRFDCAFYPTQKSTRHRWASIRIAHLEGYTLPPIEVIQVGRAYYIRDGHHRVSVGRFMGQAYIDACVIEHVVRPRHDAA